MVKGKQKGNAFENLIYKDLRDNDHGRVQKSLGSGSTDEPSDLLFTSKRGDKYVIECKHYKSLSYQLLLKFYKKTEKDSKEKLNSFWIPLVVYRVNNGPIMCLLMHSGIRCMMKYEDWKVRLLG